MPCGCQRPGSETFFLWGPRRPGKTTLLRETYPEAHLGRPPQGRRVPPLPRAARAAAPGDCHAGPRPVQVVIDEVQKVPALLDEVHWLHENRRIRFALCGSSARKVKRGAANLLGRARGPLRAARSDRRRDRESDSTSSASSTTATCRASTRPTAGAPGSRPTSATT